MTSTGREDDALAEEARRIFRAEMQRRGYSFKRLAERLAELQGGEGEGVQALINKVNRGRFTFAFFIRAMRAMGVAVAAVSEVDFSVRDLASSTPSAASPTRRRRREAVKE